MKVTNNLASEPFQRKRPIIVISAVVAALLVVSLGVLVYMNIANRWEARETSARIAELQQEITLIGQQRNTQQAVLRDPRYAEALEQTVFINTLLRRKGISWTRLFDDLSTVLPYNVRIMRVRPQVTPANEVFLDMDVAAQTGEPVVKMLRQMEGSALFGPTEIHTLLAPSESEPYFRYRISVSYKQKLDAIGATRE